MGNKTQQEQNYDSVMTYLLKNYLLKQVNSPDLHKRVTDLLNLMKQINSPNQTDDSPTKQIDDVTKAYLRHNFPNLSKQNDVSIVTDLLNLMKQNDDFIATGLLNLMEQINPSPAKQINNDAMNVSWRNSLENLRNKNDECKGLRCLG